ncbi:MAG: N-acetyltransferase family protein [Chitinophagaceae bacterium]|nr:MAG: N-acetyltransferase family protein [Chitinophagaceae bacterium]
MQLTFRKLTQKDWEKVSEIYRDGINTGIATFQTEVPEWSDWDKSHLEKGRIIALHNNQIIGWAALTAVSDRCIYAGVAEVSLYIAKDFWGKKVGTKLLQKLIYISEKEGIWTLQAGIFTENIASLNLHKSVGFRTVGMREKIGKLNNQWKDLYLLERRSKIV